MEHTPTPRKQISAVIASYNELGSIPEMHSRLTAVLSALPYDYELIFVENGSQDDSRAVLSQLAERDPHVVVVVLSRNFGSQAAFSSGLEHATGDCAVLLDGDLQDPPEMIPELVAKWSEGYAVVYGERVKRKASWPLRIAYKAFYRIFSRLSYLNIPVDAGDFGLIDRRVIQVINSMPEVDRFLRGLRAWAGFRQCGVTYHRAARHAGKSTNSMVGLFSWAVRGLVSFSYAPLQLISLVSVCVIALTGAAIVVYMVLFFVTPPAPRGFETVLVSVLFLGAVQLLCLSIIGAYLGQIFQEVKRRPKYVVDCVIHHGTPGTGADDRDDAELSEAAPLAATPER
jgi:glycosyltransferase involved in cell wall biosynthesis